MRLFFVLGSFFLVPLLSFSQIKGTVKDENGNAMPYVSIIVEGTYIGTTTNDLGKYELSVKSNVAHGNLIFQMLGYKTQKIEFNQPNQRIDVVLVEENFELNEVSIASKENPANRIVRKAIQNRKAHSELYQRFTADFYSRGIFKLKNMPKKILGQEVGDMDGALDSTGTGIIYLSETMSKVAFDQPDKFSETIVASKVSGDNKGYSYNTAMGTRFDFYQNTLPFMGMGMISPIADQAFMYYTFKLETSFRDDHQFLINKIKVIPRRDNEPVFDGFVYIVEDTWTIYAVELSAKGYRMANEFTKTLGISQQYTYNINDGIWAKHQQIINIHAGAFGIDFYGKYNHVFSNYDFKRTFEKKDFTKELVRFEPESNQKTDDFWSTARPVPLTDEEQNDYHRKDSIKTVRSSEKYLDSIDKVHNKPKLSDLITGYTYNHSYEKWGLGFDGLVQVVNFNTVQGWTANTGFTYFKTKETPHQTIRLLAKVEYGFTEKRFRPTVRYDKRFNTVNYATLRIDGGWKTQQFNPKNPILPITNTIASLFFRDNYLKIYDKKFIGFQYSQDVLTGLHVKTGLEYSERKPLQNTDFRSWYKKDELYTSNHPLVPYDENVDPFQKHSLMVFHLSTHFNFGQKYINRPDERLNVTTKHYPKLTLTYKKGFLGSRPEYHFDFFEVQSNYTKKLSNKGDFGIAVTAGKFLNSESIAFADYKHFNGNQSYVSGLGNNLDSFNLLPYYSHSTSDAFFELHTEHNFKGYIMNKIPLLNQLRTHLVVGYHQLSLPHQKPYMEFTAGLSNVGIGKFRFFRVDYVRAYQSGFLKDGVVIGMAFLDIFDEK